MIHNILKLREEGTVECASTCNVKNSKCYRLKPHSYIVMYRKSFN